MAIPSTCTVWQDFEIDWRRAGSLNMDAPKSYDASPLELSSGFLIDSKDASCIT
jgi:hypothetical protein